MLKNKITINNKQYEIRKGTYLKQKANAVVPRIANQRIDLSDLTIWNWWAQSLWGGGSFADFVDNDLPTAFNKSENLDVFLKPGSIRLAKDLTSTAKLSGLSRAKLTKFNQGGNKYVYIGGQRTFDSTKLWRTQNGNSFGSAVINSVSGGYLTSFSEFITPPNDSRLYFGISAGTNTNYLKYTTDATFLVVSDGNWDSASGLPDDMVFAEGKLFLINDKALFDYDLTTVTKRVTNPDQGGNRGQRMDYFNGDVYWIGYGNETGRLWKYDISADQDILVYEWKASFEPKFLKFFKDRFVIGGKDWNVIAASVYTFNPTTNEIIELKTFDNDEEQDSFEYAWEYKNHLLMTVQGNTSDYVYITDGVKLAEYYKKNVSEFDAGMGIVNLNRFFVGTGKPGNEIIFSSNPNTVETSGSIDSAKIDFGLFGVQKYFGGLTVYHEPLKTGEFIKLKNRVDSTTHYSGITVAGSNSIKDSSSFDVELTSNNEGKRIEYQLIVSGTTTSNKLEIKDVAIRYLLNPEDKWEWFFEVLLIDNIQGSSKNAEMMKVDLEKALDNLIVNFKDIDGIFYDINKSGSADKGVIVENIQFQGPFLQGDKTEYIARVHLLQG